MLCVLAHDSWYPYKNVILRQPANGVCILCGFCHFSANKAQFQGGGHDDKSSYPQCTHVFHYNKYVDEAME